MSAHLVRLSPSRTGQTLVNNRNAVIVFVDDESVDATADARAAAQAGIGGPDGIWSDATVTELTEANLAAPVYVTI